MTLDRIANRLAAEYFTRRTARTVGRTQDELEIYYLQGWLYVEHFIQILKTPTTDEGEQGQPLELHQVADQATV